MKVLLLVPKEGYDHLLSACETAAPEYAVLRNGLVEVDSKGLPQIKILCDFDKAQTLLDFARQVSPDIFAAIREVRNIDELSSN